MGLTMLLVQGVYIAVTEWVGRTTCMLAPAFKNYKFLTHGLTEKGYLRYPPAAFVAY